MARGVIVTGASSGIGLGIAIKYLEEGDNVVLVGRSLERLQAALPPDFKPKGRPFFVAKDLNKNTMKACKELIEESVKLLGRLDVLVNNAGAGRFGLTLDKMTEEDWHSHMELNVAACLWLTQAAAPHLEATKGSIVNISSIAAKRAFAGATLYCISKAAVDHLTCCTALELAPKGVRVNAINPATVETNFFTAAGMTQDIAATYMSSAAKTHPIGRIGTPRDCADLCYFLTDSDKAGWLVGQCIGLDGGRLLSAPSALPRD